jgi:hypothetical protein
LSGFARLLLDSLYMSAAEAFDLASELEVTADLVVGQDAEAINNCCGLADGLHNLIRIKVEV